MFPTSISQKLQKYVEKVARVELLEFVKYIKAFFK